MLKLNILFIFIITFKLVAQPIPTEYYSIVQKDSIYYVLTDNSLLKFYSLEASGEFFLTNYIEESFPSSAKVRANNEHMFVLYHDTIKYYSNQNAWDLTLEGAFVPGYSVTTIHPFGSYFFIRSGNTYNLLKVENGIVRDVEDSLFIHPGQWLVFFTYPYVVIGRTVYKYVEGFDFYAVTQISVSNVNTGITGNQIIAYFYSLGPLPGEIYSDLHTIVIEEPNFSHDIQHFWGMNIPELHINFGSGLMIARKNLYFMTWAAVITTYDSQLAYLPTASDRATITDYYIFLLGGDTLKYSRWHDGSTFYPFTWTDLTNVKQADIEPLSYSLSQNYPNPFNPTTTIKYEIPELSFVTLKVYDVLGNELATLVNEERAPGEYEVEFNGKGLTSGIYFYRLQAGSFVETKKMVLMK